VFGTPLRGSGYLVTKDLVLTAGHVATSSRYGIRTATSERVFEALTRWNGLDDSGIDAALLQIVDADWNPPPTTPSRFGELLSPTTSLRVHAEGFPAFQRQPDGLWDVEHLAGVVATGTRSLSRRRDHPAARSRCGRASPGRPCARGWRTTANI
jgi:hypothetical protein